MSFLNSIRRYGLPKALHNHASKITFSTTTLRSKSLYVTTPIFYVNASPHLGHLYSMLLSDTRVRWEKLNPKNRAFLLTGTDEHGLKIQEVAAKQGIECQELVDLVSQNFKVLAEKMNIKYDRFIRTTDDDHIAAVKYFWEIMESKNLIYQGSHSGWYSISDETFYPENQIESITDASTGKEKKISKETKNEVKYQEETNYFFRLSKFQDDLIQFLENHPNFIKPQNKYNELLKELKESKLTDLSVSRPSSRLNWGIEVPNDPSQKIYVWFDALMNYLTAAGFPCEFELQNGLYNTPENNLWPATHVIGKDIIRFHCIYWPIFLMAAGIGLPKQVIVHSHWLSDGFKMSKSLGNVVDPMSTNEYYGQDALRFFLMENSNIETDCNYSEKNFFHTRENLIGKYANLITRCGGASFNIREAVDNYYQGKFNDINQLLKTHLLNQEDLEAILDVKSELVQDLNGLYESMNGKFSSFDQMKAIQDWWSVNEKANLLFQLGQPWIYKKAINNESSEEKKHAYEIIRSFYVFMAAETGRIASILIYPVMPELSTRFLDRLAVDAAKRNSDYCTIGSDPTYGTNANSKLHKVPIERVPMRGD